MKEALRYLAGVAGPSGYGSNSTAEQVTQDCSCPLPSHHQLTAIVTGATSGIGAETARVLAKRGVRIVVPVRDLKKGAQLKERIQKETPEAKIVLLEIDLSSFASIKRFCSEFLSLNFPLNILINNAGKFSNKLEFSEDKIEMTFATNYLGHFLLTELLLEKMIETAAQTGTQGRIVNVSSVIHSWVERDNFYFNQMLQPKKLPMIMKEALRYLAGVAGPSGYGSNSTAEQVTQDCSFLRPSYHPLTAIVTGATSGIGVETARVLAKRGVRIVVPARDLKKGAQLKEMIQKESPEAKIVLLEIDLGSFASIKSFCSEFLSLNLPLNILINNAGKLSNKLEFSEDKFEMTFATNYLDFLCLVPGKFLKSIAQGASTTCYVALSPKTEGVNGSYFVDCNESRCSSLANDESEALQLWNQTRAL
ncbi:hypothetical protein RJ639_030358 [Escallonia herrerae]|uniref:Uncharacterized protein n=1 Tax=Escallonia herrerae TaxID=1293975 RepID=A0AA88XF97_9ASTE|nr:hypothetical protein RJ639_030358 [Escallonia herrerae]